jgi:hypothetical protein
LSIFPSDGIVVIRGAKYYRSYGKVASRTAMANRDFDMREALLLCGMLYRNTRKIKT